MSGGLTKLKSAYTDEARRIAAESMTHLGKTRVTPTALSAAGVLLGIAGAVLVYFEYVHWSFFLIGSFVFLVGAILDILDGALARTSDRATPFGAFFDSTVDRVGEFFMLGAIALVLMRDGSEWGVALTIAALAGSFLVSYARARAELIGFRGDIGFGSRTERVAVICLGLAFAPLGSLPWTMLVLTVATWITVAQRMLSVRQQLMAGHGPGGADPDEPGESDPEEL